MSTPDPIKLLEKKLEEHEVALHKSKGLYDLELIDAAVHLMHKENLSRLIADYKQAIYLLKLHENEERPELNKIPKHD
jgi:hypothetical protein